ncbi:MAG TPA: DUF2007 domain-containing protein [Rhizomicrobium sp.]|jgi:hypothetical protein|nr:DUF2007 domain-containing protein [Rhizomicrobium sp.]
MSDQLVTIASQLNPWEAHILKGRLEADGIFAVVIDENNFSYGMWATSSGVRVQVQSENVARALEIKRGAHG